MMALSWWFHCGQREGGRRATWWVVSLLGATLSLGCQKAYAPGFANQSIDWMAWTSPDRIAYSYSSTDQSGIFEQDISTGTRKRIYWTRLERFDSDGRHILSFDYQGIFEIDIETGAKRQVPCDIPKVLPMYGNGKTFVTNWEGFYELLPDGKTKLIAKIKTTGINNLFSPDRTKMALLIGSRQFPSGYGFRIQAVDGSGSEYEGADGLVVGWLDNHTVLYSLPVGNVTDPRDAKKWQTYKFDLTNRQTSLFSEVSGSPTATSPDGRLVAFNTAQGIVTVSASGSDATVQVNFDDLPKGRALPPV